MGCDIHLFIEYTSKRYAPDYWAYLGSEFHLNRHYGVFAALANVRNYGNTIKPISSPRGFPDNAGASAREKYFLFITDKIKEEGYVSREEAKIWIEKGTSRYWGNNDNFISNPDAHSASYLSLDDFRKALDTKLTTENGNIQGLEGIEDYRAVAAAMEYLESSGFDTRVVFWFDN